jgi:hypothetical protein
VDLAAHIGERLFAVCLPNTGEAGADSAAARMLNNAEAYSLTVLMAICPRDGLDQDTLIKNAVPFTPGMSRVVPLESANSAQLAELLESEVSGRVPLSEGQTARSTKARLRRASKRAGVSVKLWEEDGAIHFERLEHLRSEESAA